MKSVNRSVLLGHVVADPELRETKTKKTVCSFAIATNNEWYDADGVQQKSVDFHRIVAWEGLANLAHAQLKKGSPVYVEGRLTNRSYEGKDQIRRYLTEIVVNQIHILKWEKNQKSVKAEELAVA